MPRGTQSPTRFILAAWCALAAFAAPSLTAQSAPGANAATDGQTLTGIDVLEAQHFEALAGKRIGLITNQTGVDRKGRSTIFLLAHAPGVKLVAVFSPEHGLAGAQDTSVSSSVDSTTGLPIYSLYGDTKRPTDAMLSGVDVLVFDLQDAGVRFFTYIATMGYAMEAAAQHHIAFYVLDRPDPLGGERVEGPMLDSDRVSFTAYFPMPVIPGMTLGEMARMFNAENHIGCDLHVIAIRNWRRGEWFDQTGLAWISPSPNLRSFQAELIYPGLEILQNAGISVGRGTSTPFEQFGAPWIHAEQLVAELNRRSIPAVRFASARFTPVSGVHQGELCEGAHAEVIDRRSLDPMRLGLEIAATLRQLYPANFDAQKMMLLLGSQSTVDQLNRGEQPTAIMAGWKESLAPFMAMRAKYLLYP
ncbi:MAG: DUF1343 domain-containing protein [Candidatus Acidiferrales bacterium]|jgi:uncharacterized protein YbbC (DUF1343 family)